ncbi:hypothetical protein ABIB00_007431 [Bradyrhizobium sp. LB14.3]
MIFVEGDEPAFGDGDAMGVAAEMGQHLCGPAEGPLGVNNPVDASHGVEVGRKGAGSARAPRSPKKRKAPKLKAPDRRLRKSVRNSLDNGLTASSEVRSASDPARAIGREATTRNDAMDVGMMH